MTLAGSIKTVLQSNWNLTDALGTANVTFKENWYDSTILGPQVTITNSDGGQIKRYFGGSVRHSYPQFHVNIWVRVPVGSSGTAEAQDAEDMRLEACRIIMEKKADVSPFISLVPTNEGLPLHEIDGPTPRIMRYEITVKGATST